MESIENYELKILLAEDSNFFVMNVKKLLQDYHKNVKFYVVNRIKQLEEKIEKVYPDILILDLYFPDGESLERIKPIKTLYPDIEIIVASAQSDIRIALQAIGEGADHYVVKDEGFKPDIIVALNSILDKIKLKKRINKLNQSVFNPDIYPMIVYKASEAGVDIVEQDFEDFPENINKTTQEFLNVIGLNIIVALGQGHEYHEGCYNFPAGGSKFYSLLVFTMRIPDPSATDARLKMGYYQIAIFIPKTFQLMFPSTGELASLIDTIKDILPDSSHITLKKLNIVKNLVLNKVKQNNY